MDAIWQVKWVNRGTERGETLVTISGDGRVTEWSLKKGLSHVDLMTLKRIPNKLAQAEHIEDGIIARSAAGQCIDFPATDSSVYYVGTGGRALPCA